MKIIMLSMVMLILSSLGAHAECVKGPAGSKDTAVLNLNEENASFYHKWIGKFKKMLVNAGLDEETAKKAVNHMQDTKMAEKTEELRATLKKLDVSDEKIEETIDNLRALKKQKMEEKIKDLQEKLNE